MSGRHYHCPNDCEKPQPARTEDDVLICQRCLYEGRGLVEVKVIEGTVAKDGGE